MKHSRAKKELSQAKRLLLTEEFRSEEVISIIRIIAFSYFTATGIIRTLVHGEDLLTAVLPVSIVSIASIILLVYSFASRKRVLKTGSYSDAAKYFHITIDVAIIAFLNHFIINSVLESWPAPDLFSSLVLYSVFFMLTAGLYLFINVFRFHPFASLYAGILLFVHYFLLFFFIPVFQPILHDPAVYQEKIPILLIFIIISLFIFEVILSVLVTTRMRRLLVKNIQQDRLMRFLPETIVNDTLRHGGEILEKAEKRVATILFADIRGFTALAETLKPEEVIDFLNTYYNDMIEIIFKYQGAIDKIVGDGLMAIFSEPASEPSGKQTAHRKGKPSRGSEADSTSASTVFFPDGTEETTSAMESPSGVSAAAANAVKAAVDMCRKLESLNELRSFHKQPLISIGIGIHTGEVILGCVGTGRRMDFTAIGDTVNTASRLEQCTKAVSERIIISETTRSRLSPGFPAVALGKVTLRGKTQPLRIFTVKTWVNPNPKPPETTIAGSFQKVPI
jgi:class 3 adenylate cyclase